MLLYGLMSSFVNDCFTKGGGLVGNGCVGHVCSPGISLFGTGRSSIGQIGSPVTRSKTNRKPFLFASATTSIAAAVLPDRCQLRRRVVVEVPQIVVRRLEVPQAFAGSRIERDQAIGEQVHPDAVGAVVVVGRRAGREDTRCRAFRRSMISPQVFVPPMYFHASLGHVS